MLRARLLGAFEVTLDGRALAGLNAPRLQAVLAHLMLHRGTLFSRQHIAFTFWPDTPEDKARNNLRQIIHQLRHALPDADHFLQADASAIGWLNAPDFQLDIADFENAIAKMDAARKAGHAHDEMAALQSAAGAYGGDLLPGCYDDWVLPERERLRQAFAEVLDRLAALHETERNLPAAIAAMQRRLELDSLHEASYVTLMRLHALNDDRAGALRVYQAGVSAFKQEMGFEPSVAMREAHEQLLRAGAQMQAQTPSEELLPLIGRRREWEQLLDAWQGSTKGQPQFASIAGEAGIGKTRLAEELMAWARRQGIGVAHARAYAAEGRLSFAPAVEWLRSDVLHGALKRLDGVWLSEVGRILPEVFVAQPSLPQPAAMTDPTQRTRFFEALARAVLLARQPLLLVMDDAQWCDQDTLEWLRFLLRFDARAKLLVVATCRSEEVDDKHPLMALLRDLRNAGAMHEIELHRLDAAETAKLAMHILKREVDLSEATRLYGDTEGNPLFTVELARAGLQRGAEVKPDDSMNLPPRIHAVITARFAQLSAPAMEVMQLGATVGRAFTFDVLLKASEASEESLLRSLDELWQRRIVRSVDGSGYDFTHDKLREVAYGQIGPVKRRLLHRRAAQAIEAVHAADLDPVSAQLAAQFELAGSFESSVVMYIRAIKVAQRVFANEEAMLLSIRGLSLLTNVEPGTKRDEFELALRAHKAVNAVGTLGHTAVDQYQELLIVQALSQKLNRPLAPWILRSLAIIHVVRDEFDQSRLIGEELLEIGETRKDDVSSVEAHYVLGVSHLNVGQFTPARKHFAQALDIYNPSYTHVHVVQFGWDPKAICWCRLAETLWCLGYLDQAVLAQKASIAWATQVDHPFSIGYSMFYEALLLMKLHRFEEARVRSEATINHSQQYKTNWWLRYGVILRGWSVAAAGDLENGIRQMEAGIAELDTLGSHTNRVFFHAQLSSLYAKRSEHDRALRLVDESIEVVSRPGGQLWCLSELLRVRGDVLLLAGVDKKHVEAVYLDALATANSQEAKLLELRAAICLARLWQSQDRANEARDLLQPIYDWFTEGFDTHDLKEAKALLDELTLS